jgi:MOSC domain-containing protein YiiM
MKILSVNTGAPQELSFNGVTLKTSMIRTAQAKIEIKFLQVQGDEFFGKTIHGTPDCVVYALCADKYKQWESKLKRPMPWGIFGENLTIDLMNEDDFKINDEYQAGSALLRVTGPRYPCNRLNFVTGIDGMRELFRDQAWPGVYFEVMTEGEVKAGDELILKKRTQSEVSVKDLFLSIRATEIKAPKDETITRVLATNFILERHMKRIRAQYT